MYMGKCDVKQIRINSFRSYEYDCVFYVVFFFQAEDGIRDLVRSRGLGDVYKRQLNYKPEEASEYELYVIQNKIWHYKKKKLSFCPESVSYTHLTLPTIYSV